MEKSLLELLKELDAHYPNYVNANVLTTKKSELTVISFGIKDGVIDLMDERDRNAYGELDGGALIRLTSDGFALINQIKTRKALEDFSTSSAKLSKALNTYTALLLLLTIIISAGTITDISLVLNKISFPFNIILIIGMVGLFVVVGIIFLLYFAVHGKEIITNVISDFRNKFWRK
ncbi:MAG: hypothetical protein KGH53_01325 [Candidatus Micrarchaeota archaeon]|nr:hypothetical protein [Candidatus Micrarchaeota archaeon]